MKRLALCVLAALAATACAPASRLRTPVRRGEIHRIAFEGVLGDRRPAARAVERIREALGQRPAFGWVRPAEDPDAELRVSVFLAMVPYPPETGPDRIRSRENRTVVAMTLIRTNDDRIVWRDSFEARWYGDAATEDWKESVDLAVSVLIDKLKEDLAPAP